MESLLQREHEPAQLKAIQGQLYAMAFPHPFRRCQTLALEAFETARAKGRRRLHVVLPPGAGKTLLGLEMARRLGMPTMVLCPNTAIQAQWGREWEQFQPALVPHGHNGETLAPVTVLTYQALCVLEDDSEELEERSLSLWQVSLQQSEGLTASDARGQIEWLREVGSPHYRTELARFRRRARMLIARGGEREELLALLHPNGRRLLERMKRLGPWTLVLDECHHLLETWGYLVRALVQELGDEAITVGLTATPPRDLDARQQDLYRDLFQETDFELPTPAAVKDGSLAPYQDLVYVTAPLPHELDYIDEQHGRFLRLISRLMDEDFGSLPFVEWVRRRAWEPSTRGRGVSWTGFENDRPTVALAVLRFLHRYRLELPEGVQLRERHRRDLDADDWVVLLEDYCLRHLKPSGDPRDAAAWQEIRAALPSVGYVLTAQGIRSYVSPVDRVLALSAGKGAAALAILDAEGRALGEQLRALLLCDYEQAGSDLLARLRGILDPQAGSAALLMRLLLADSGTARLNPILVTGRTVACSRSTAYELVGWLEAETEALKGELVAEPLSVAGHREPEWEDLVVVRSASPWWRSRNYVPLVTEYFERGCSRCLVGTRGLLGEGWNAKRVNVLVDLTAATTSTAVHQSRGRSLRLDPMLPGKVADNWDVVCVSPGHPKGFSDYSRFVRKHRHYYALTADGEIESGVSHVHPDLSPYGAPPTERFEAINRAMLQRPRAREEVGRRWAVGEPYENREVETLRVRFGRRPTGADSLAGRRKASSQDPRRDWEGRGPGCWIVLGFLLGLAVLGLGMWSSLAHPLLAVATVGLPPLLWLLWVARSPLLRNDETGGIGPMARAVAEGLRRAGATSCGADRLRVVPQSDGYFRCYLEGASAEESVLFAEALEELVSPLEGPRCIVPRYLLAASGRRRLSELLDLYRGRGVGKAAVVYHAVPAFFSANGKRVEAFKRAWHRHVSPGRVLYSHGRLAKAILEAQRGENVMEVSTQARTLWR